jgi:hypothetical protein
MSKKEDETFENKLDSTERPREAGREDLLGSTAELISQPVPPGVDRRTFLMRSAVGGAAAVMMGTPISAQQRTAKALATMPPPP